MDGSAIMCNEIIEEVQFKCLNESKENCKTQSFYILLAFLLIAVALLIAVSIYCYLIKYQGKQINLLPFHFTNNKLKEIIYKKFKYKISNKLKDIDKKKPDMLSFRLHYQYKEF